MAYDVAEYEVVVIPVKERLHAGYLARSAGKQHFASGLEVLFELRIYLAAHNALNIF